jgi:hypothetical protein
MERVYGMELPNTPLEFESILQNFLKAERLLQYADTQAMLLQARKGNIREECVSALCFGKPTDRTAAVSILTSPPSHLIPY